jgi:hypothetical protein
MGGHQIQGLGDATDDSDAITKKQVDDAIAAIDLSTLAPINSPTFTGDPKAPTPATADNDTSIATTAYVKANLASYAPLASPVLTGTPTAPTASAGNNSTQIATTAYVDTAQVWRAVAAAADQSVVATASLADWTGFSFAVAANKTYCFRLVFSCDNFAAGGSRIAFTAPASPTSIWYGGTVGAHTGSGTSPINSGYVATAGAASAASPIVGWSNVIGVIEGVLVNGSNAGTVQVQIAQSSASGTTTFRKGSFLQYVEIA